MSKLQFKNSMFNVPTTQVILGSLYNGKPNFMALGWITRVNHKPALFAISVNNGHATNEAINKSGEFSVSVPSTAMVEKTDYVGLVSGRNTDKSQMFNIFYGELAGALMIQESPLTLSFKLHSTVKMPSNTLFIGELVESWCEEACLTDGKPDMTKIKPFMLSMPENYYFPLGEKVGDAWKSGKVLKK